MPSVQSGMAQALNKLQVMETYSVNLKAYMVAPLTTSFGY